MSDPYRAPPGAAVDVKLVIMFGDRPADTEAQLARLLKAGYVVAAHSGCCNELGTLRLVWTMVKAEADS